MVCRRPRLNAAFGSLSSSNAQVWQNNLGWEHTAATLWGYKLEFNLCSLAKLKPSSAIITPLMFVFHSLSTLPSSWVGRNSPDLEEYLENLKIRFSVTTKIPDFYQCLNHMCTGLKGFLEMVDSEKQYPQSYNNLSKGTSDRMRKQPSASQYTTMGSSQAPTPRKSSLQVLDRKSLTIVTLIGPVPDSTKTELKVSFFFSTRNNYIKSSVSKRLLPFIVSDPCLFWCSWVIANEGAWAKNYPWIQGLTSAPDALFSVPGTQVSSFCLLPTPACVPWLPGSWGLVWFPFLLGLFFSASGDWRKLWVGRLWVSMENANTHAGFSFCYPL